LQELLLSGVPDIDVEDWKKNTSYQAGFTADDETIKVSIPMHLIFLGIVDLCNAGLYYSMRT